MVWLEQPGQRGGAQVVQRRTEYPWAVKQPCRGAKKRCALFEKQGYKLVMSKCDSKFRYTCEKGRSRCRLAFCIRNNGLLAGACVTRHVQENKIDREFHKKK